MRVEVKDYVKTIGKATVLNHVSYTFESGKIYGLRGKNGSGKTMLMRAICGLINPTEGCICIDGKIIGKDISFPGIYQRLHGFSKSQNHCFYTKSNFR